MHRFYTVLAHLWPPHGVVFTLITAGLLLGAATASGSLTKALTPTWQDRLGYAPRDLFSQQWHGMFTSALVTSGGKGFWPAFGAAISLVLVAEWLTGTRTTAVTFWASHLGATISVSLLIILALLFSHSAMLNEIYTLRDVGPSAGYFGCMGLIAKQIPRPWNYLTGLAILCGLLGGIVVSTQHGATIDVAAGVAHLLAFPIGWSIGSVPFMKKLRTQGYDHEHG